jgi:hypothetical protein
MESEAAKLPKWARFTVAGLCILTGITACIVAAIVLAVTVRPLWLMFGFEVVTFVACVLGLLFAFGKFQNGQGLALGCVAACIFVGAVLNYISTRGILQTNDASGGIGLRWYLISRVVAAAVVALVGCTLVLSRNPRSMMYLGRAALFGVPLIAALGAGAVFRASVLSALAALPVVVWALVLIVGGLFGVILASGAVHCLIRAFEHGRTEELNPGA